MPLYKRKAEGLIFRDAGQPNTDQRRGAAALDIDPWIQFSGAVALDTGIYRPPDTIFAFSAVPGLRFLATGG